MPHTIVSFIVNIKYDIPVLVNSALRLNGWYTITCQIGPVSKCFNVGLKGYLKNIMKGFILVFPLQVKVVFTTFITFCFYLN